MSLHFWNDKEFFKTFFKLAIPVTFQYFIAASLNLIDNIMVGQLGEAELAAVGLANQVYFLLILFILGVSSGASIFASQFWGTKDVTNIRRVLGLSTLISLGAAFIFFVISVSLPRGILGLFSNDPEVVRLGSTFLTISSFTFMMTAMTSCYAAVLRSTGEVRLPTLVNSLALGVNTILNYCLIFGNLGFPALGVAGSATATVIARLIETILMLTFSYRYKLVVAGTWKELTDISAALAKRFLSATGTVVLKDITWAIGVTIYMVVYAKMGTSVVAAVNIVTNIRQLAYVLFNGIASACLVMVGNEIGKNNSVKAFNYGRRFLRITFLIGIIIGSITALGSRWILAPYNISAEVFRTSQALLLAFAIFTPFSVYNMVCVVGVLRSGGDTAFCLIMDLIAVYFIGMPLAFLGQAVWKLNAEWVFTLITLQELFKFWLCLRRFVTKRWINNLVHDFSGGPVTATEQG